MPINRSTKPLSFLKLFERFIRDTKRGKRLLPNGERISKGTVASYNYTLNILKRFCIAKGFYLRIIPVYNLSSLELSRERNYWQNFYKKISDFMYAELGYFDNYAGLNIKNIRAFFNYLNKNRGLGAGEFHKSFYVRKQETSIFPLTPEQLNYLIYNKEFEDSLNARMKQVKYFFVFGCTVALRFSDLKSLRTSNIKFIDQNHYLVVRSKKTNRESVIKLPTYSIEILDKYTRFKKKILLPNFNIANLNLYIKRLLEKAGYT
jgi:site-specific recombinase XerD